ncbi:hypothetical protein GH733_013619, partial [Mirounga leonina]
MTRTVKTRFFHISEARTWPPSVKGTLGLERRTETAEKSPNCEKTAVEFGNQLEGKWAVLGTLLQEYGLLQRRLEKWELLGPEAASGQQGRSPQ